MRAWELSWVHGWVHVWVLPWVHASVHAWVLPSVPRQTGKRSAVRCCVRSKDKRHLCWASWPSLLLIFPRASDYKRGTRLCRRTHITNHKSEHPVKRLLALLLVLALGLTAGCKSPATQILSLEPVRLKLSAPTVRVVEAV